jgi:hypothetical protein
LITKLIANWVLFQRGEILERGEAPNYIIGSLRGTLSLFRKNLPPSLTREGGKGDRITI